MATYESWEVVHGAMPRPETFSYPNEDEARAAYDRHKFYDPDTGWGVALVHRITTVETLASTYPEKKRGKR